MDADFPRSITFLVQNEEEFKAILAGRATVVETKAASGSTYVVGLIRPEPKKLRTKKLKARKARGK